MPRIVIKNAAVEENTTSKGTVMRSQTAGLDLGNGYELPFRVGLGSRPAYPVGKYDIDPACFTLGQYGDLQLKRYVDLIRTDVVPAKSA